MKTALTKWALLAVLFAGVACLRLYYCTQLPINTGDILRHLYYGIYVDQSGLAVAGQALAEINPSLSKVSWSAVPYNYPAVTLLLFWIIGKLSPTIFFSKLVLTLIEALSSWLVFKYSRQPLLALLYWASPISIWWVSHEGQFEPLQNLLAIAALCMLSKRQSWAFALLALAVQVKLTAILLLPYFVLSVFRHNSISLARALGAFALGFFPTALAAFYYPVVSQILSTARTLTLNPHYWDVFNRAMLGGNPLWVDAANQLASYGMLLLLAGLAFKSKDIKGFAAPIAFVLFSKTSQLFQPWYFVLQPSFLLPIQDKNVRMWLFALTLLLDVTSPIRMLIGPFGYTVGDYYEGMNAFTELH